MELSTSCSHFCYSLLQLLEEVFKSVARPGLRLQRCKSAVAFPTRRCFSANPLPAEVIALRLSRCAFSNPKARSQTRNHPRHLRRSQDFHYHLGHLARPRHCLSQTMTTTLFASRHLPNPMAQPTTTQLRALTQVPSIRNQDSQSVEALVLRILARLRAQTPTMACLRGPFRKGQLTLAPTTPRTKKPTILLPAVPALLIP